MHTNISAVEQKTFFEQETFFARWRPTKEREDKNISNNDRFQELNIEEFESGWMTKRNIFYVTRQGFGDNCEADNLKVFTHQ